MKRDPFVTFGKAILVWVIEVVVSFMLESVYVAQPLDRHLFARVFSSLASN
jgi:hypothetical protein